MEIGTYLMDALGKLLLAKGKERITALGTLFGYGDFWGLNRGE